MIDLQSRFTVNHHDNAKFTSALGTGGLGESGGALQSNIIFFHTVDETLDDPSLSCLEISEQFIAALTFNVDDLTCFHPKLFFLIKHG